MKVEVGAGAPASLGVQNAQGEDETDPAVNLNGKSETFNKPKPHNRTHVHRCSDATLTSPYLDRNTWGRRLQKRIDEPEGELRKEQSEWVNVQVESEKAFAHAVFVG